MSSGDRGRGQKEATIAVAQHGVFSRSQALSSGISRHQIDRRVKSGAWRVVHPGVYAMPGVPLNWKSFLVAACLYGGEGSAASHRSAAALWSLRGFRPEVVEITCTRHLRKPPFIVHHAEVARGCSGYRDGIP